MTTDWPSYLALGADELERRAVRILATLVDCRACPRACGRNRLQDEVGDCRTGRRARVASWFAHFGEEDCLRGQRGSGTIFFAGCNLGCKFCQNHETSQGDEGRELDGEALAQAMLRLATEGCHNINLVTPSHVVPQILEALAIAVRRGLNLPIVYNSGGYDALETLRELDGVVDVYMPDFKLWSPELASRFLGASDYPAVARAAVAEMHRQVGILTIDSGLARRGMLVRHLVMPGQVADSRQVFDFLASLSRDTYVNVMAQYHPAHRASRDPALARSSSFRDVDRAVEAFHGAGLRRRDRPCGGLPF